MKKIIWMIGLFSLALLQGGCKDEFGKTLFGPDQTVAPEDVSDRVVLFVNTTESENITGGSEISTTPFDVVFASNQPIGQTKQVKVAVRLKTGKSLADQSLSLNVVNDEKLLEVYKEQNGYKPKFLPESAYKLVNDLVSIEQGERESVNQCEIRIINSLSLVVNQDYVLPVKLNAAPGFIVQDDNSTIFIHVKRKGGSGEMEGAANLNPMPGDNVLDPDGADKGINRNNLYYELDDVRLLKDLDAFTIEGLIYVDAFKDESERVVGHLAGISSLWGYDSGSGAPFLLRFGDASVSSNQLQLVVNNDKKYPVNYKFKTKQWYHVAVVYDGSNLKVYVDAKERFSVEQTGKISLAGPTFGIGYSFNQWRGLNGKMSELRIWKQARTPKQLKDNMLDVMELDGERANLIAYWKMNKAKEGSDNKLIGDVSGNGLDIVVKRQGAACPSCEPVVVIDNDIDINF